MTTREVQVGDRIVVFGVVRTIRKITPYAGPLAAIIASTITYDPGPCREMSLAYGERSCTACGYVWMDCQCSRTVTP